MLTVQVSVPELKAHAQAIREMAQDPMTTLQTLAGDLRPRFEGWLNDLMKAELALHLGREPYERKAPSKNRAQILAANVDQALLVFAAREPVPKPGLLDRFLVACRLVKVTLQEMPAGNHRVSRL